MEIIKVRFNSIFVSGAHVTANYVDSNANWYVILKGGDSFDDEFPFYPVSVETLVLHATFSYLKKR